MADDKGLELRTIAERFAQSESALDELIERLQSLKATSDVLELSNQSTQAMTHSIRQVSDELSALTGMLRNSVDVLRTAATNAANFMNQTDLTGLNTQVGEIKNLLNSRLSESDASREAAERAHAATKAELENERQKSQKLEAQLAQVPEKYRKKYVSAP